MSRLDNDLVCPFCSQIRGGVLSLGIHIHLTHYNKEQEFAQMICDSRVLSLKQKYEAKNKDRRVASSIARDNSIRVRYYKTSRSNYKMPQEFRFLYL